MTPAWASVIGTLAARNLLLHLMKEPDLSETGYQRLKGALLFLFKEPWR